MAYIINTIVSHTHRAVNTNLNQQIKHMQNEVGGVQDLIEMLWKNDNIPIFSSVMTLTMAKYSEIHVHFCIMYTLLLLRHPPKGVDKTC